MKYIELPGIQYLYGIVPVVVSVQEGCNTCYSFKFHDLWDKKCSVANTVFNRLFIEEPFWTGEFNINHPFLNNLTEEQITMLKGLEP